MTHVRKAIDGAAWEEAHIGTFTGCAGPCDQGRRLCPCPEACNRPAEEPGARDWKRIGLAVVLASAALVIVSCVAVTSHFSQTHQEAKP
jgi:hypothetical protein